MADLVVGLAYILNAADRLANWIYRVKRYRWHVGTLRAYRVGMNASNLSATLPSTSPTHLRWDDPSLWAGITTGRCRDCSRPHVLRAGLCWTCEGEQNAKGHLNEAVDRIAAARDAETLD